jgi:HEPN domain-containing protein
MQTNTPQPPDSSGGSDPTPQALSLVESAEWLARADQDLQAAQGVLSLARPLPAIAVYHAQQTGEKALKAFLVAANVRFRFTHNLVELVAACSQLDQGFASIEAEAVLLTL